MGVVRVRIVYVTISVRPTPLDVLHKFPRDTCCAAIGNRVRVVARVHVPVLGNAYISSFFFKEVPPSQILNLNSLYLFLNRLRTWSHPEERYVRKNKNMQKN